MSFIRASCGLAAALVLASGAGAAPAARGAGEAADLVLSGGKIYTVDPRRRLASAVAVRDGRVSYVGSGAGARAFIGPNTRLEKLAGRTVLPGLVDAHVHPIDTVELDVCDLKNQQLSLAKIAALVAQCVVHYAPPPGTWLTVHEWDYTGGNQPGAKYRTLRQALDAASREVPIHLLGNDGHHYAFNSAGLARAKDASGRLIGLSKATLAGEFAAYRPFVGVDEFGEPNGAVNEDAAALLHLENTLYDNDLAEVAKVAHKIPERMNAAGITAVLDAMASPEGLPIYDALAAGGQLSMRVRLALFFDPSKILTATGQPDYAAMVTRAQRIRAKYANDPLIRADTVKLFGDGGLEGNPYAVPPTMPNAAALHPFRQPIFAVDAGGHPTVRGYVDTASARCTGVRAHPENYAAAEAINAFRASYGYHPGQCAIVNGELQHPREVMFEFVRRMHLAGFNLHVHVISDRTARTVLDAIEAAREADRNSGTRDTLAHLQLVAPEEVQRIGHDHLYAAFTYAWMSTVPDYDITVIPFFDAVHGNDYRALHRPDGYYEQNAYPVRTLKEAGGILTASSDAPVDTRDPRPFVNMSMAITRRLPGKPPLNPRQAIAVRDVIEAYTINGARQLGIDAEAGSIEVGKSADFAVIDRDIVALADAGHPEAIAATRVLATWFRGKKVYARPGAH